MLSLRNNIWFRGSLLQIGVTISKKNLLAKILAKGQVFKRLYASKCMYHIIKCTEKVKAAPPHTVYCIKFNQLYQNSNNGLCLHGWLPLAGLRQFGQETIKHSS